jgi:uncharacterized membrane protein YtjA (UPF0391 family)
MSAAAQPSGAPSYTGKRAVPQCIGLAADRRRPAQHADCATQRIIRCVRRPPQRAPICSIGGWPMLHYAVVFFVIALIAALFGFGGIAASAVGIAKILFIVFAVLTVASLLIGLVRSR